MSQVKREPLLKIDIKLEKQGDNEITFELDTLLSQPIVRVKDNYDGSEYSIDMSVAMDLNPSGFYSVYRAFIDKVTELRQAYNDPSGLTGILSYDRFRIRDNDKEEKIWGLSYQEYFKVYFLLEDEDNLSDKYTPYIRWVDQGNQVESERLKGLSKGDVDKVGWALFLNGFSHMALGFASWDDRQALDLLIQHMRSPNELKVMACLSYPEQAKIVSSIHSSADALRKCNNKGIEEIEGILRKSQRLEFVDKYDGRTDSYVKIGRLLLEGKEIAYQIGAQSKPLFKASKEKNSILHKYQENRNDKKELLRLSRLSKEEREAQHLEKLQNTNKRWMKIFLEEAGLEGWRLCEPFPSRDNLILNWSWVTKLSESEWHSIEPAIPLATIARDRNHDFGF